jgi:hypothetical protein
LASKNADAERRLCAGGPRRMASAPNLLPSFEARPAGSHLRMTLKQRRVAQEELPGIAAE